MGEGSTPQIRAKLKNELTEAGEESDAKEEADELREQTRKKQKTDGPEAVETAKESEVSKELQPQAGERIEKKRVRKGSDDDNEGLPSPAQKRTRLVEDAEASSTVEKWH